MANTNRYRYGEQDFVLVPVATGTAVEIGDMLKLDTGLGVVATTAGDNITLHAIALQAHEADSGATTIRCALVKPGVVYEFALNTETSITYGDELQISGAQELTQSGTDPVAIAVETNATATKIRCIFMSSVLLTGDAA